MLLWIKALFEKPETPVNPDDFVAYTDIFSLNFLSDLFTLFQEHINLDEPENFQDKIIEKLFSGRDWENSQKIMGNLEMGLNDKEVAQFLEQLSYRVWFPQMQMSGHTFTAKEKCALAGFAFFADGCVDGDYHFATIDEQVVEMRQSTPDDFINFVFNKNVDSMIEEHNKFTSKECPA